jgi:hypothetical protein
VTSGHQNHLGPFLEDAERYGDGLDDAKWAEPPGGPVLALLVLLVHSSLGVCFSVTPPGVRSTFQAPPRRGYPKSPKNPSGGVIASLFLPGLGNLINGDTPNGSAS